MKAQTTHAHRVRFGLSGALALAAVLVLAACSSDKPTSAASATSSPNASSSCAASQPDQLRNLLAAEITSALQKRDRTAFLSLAASPGAKRAMSSWWTNVDALGFTTGGAQALRTGGRHVDMSIGVHNALDPTSSRDGKARTPNVVATQYRLGVQQATSGPCHLIVTSWTSRSAAPWDIGAKLYVVHTKHTVVAGERRMKSEIDRVAPYAEKAAAWSFGFFKHNRHADYIEQNGFVLFLPSTDAQATSWFRAPTTKKPKGWIGDPTFAGGYAFPLSGVTVPETYLLPKDSPKLHPVTQITGGARTILTSAGRHYDTTVMTGVIVHEFTHDIFANKNIGYYLGGDGASSSTVEGAATLLQAYFSRSPDDPTRSRESMDTFQQYLLPQIRQHFALFRDRMPTDKEMYGAAASQFYNYDLSASGFYYEGGNGNGIDFELQCIKDAYVNGGGPFSGIQISNKGGTITFADPAKEQRAWAQAVRNTVG